MSYLAITMIVVGVVFIAVTLAQAWVRANAQRKELRKAEESIWEEQRLMLSRTESSYLKGVLESQLKADGGGVERPLEGDEIQHLHEQVFANSLLTLGAGKSSAALDTFSGWLLGGFGAALALLLSNLDSVGPYIPISTVKSAAFIFIFAAIIGVAEKYLAALVSGAVEAFLVSSDLGEKMADRDIDLDFSIIFAQTESAAFPPAKWIVRRMLQKVRQGDLVASGRFFSRCSQAQGILVLCEAVLIILATCLIVGGLTDFAA